MINKDFIITLNWPEGMVTVSNSWYDKFFSKNGKYRVGHSALILVNSKTKKLHYMDFGRYHTPDGYGRVRDAETDPDVGIPLLAEIKNNEILNIDTILKDAFIKKAQSWRRSFYISVLEGVSFKLCIQLRKENTK